MRIEDDEELRHRRQFGGIVCRVGIAGAGEGASHSPPGREGWALRPDRGRRAFSDAGRAIEQLQRLAGHAAEGVAGHRIPSRQYAGDSDLLGAVRAEAGTVRLLGGGYDPRPGARASRPSGSALVRHLEERQPALHARMDEAGAGALLPRDQQERRAGGFAVSVCHSIAGGGHARVHRLHAAPQGG